MRWMGEARMTVAAVQQLFKRGRYPGKLAYLPHVHGEV